MQILDREIADSAQGAVRTLVKPKWDSVVAGKPCGHRHRGAAAAENCARQRLNQRRTLRLNSRDDCSQYVALNGRMAVLRLGTQARGRKTQ
jgi:hypothetical protein